MFDIIADSACDFTPEMAQKIGVEIVPFYVSLDGEHYRKEGKEIAVRDFYQFMVDNPSAYPKTSLPSLEDFETAFRAHAEAGRPVLCICFTSKMSGCVGSARNARELVLEDFPDAKIEVIDSTAATVTESIVVENAVAMRDAGCTLDEAVTWLEAEKITNQIFFTVGNLDYLIKGGRIGKVTGRAAYADFFDELYGADADNTISFALRPGTGQVQTMGYRISRQVTPIQEKVPGKVSRGDLWRVTLTVDADQDMTWVALSDPIPAGARILGVVDGDELLALEPGQVAADRCRREIEALGELGCTDRAVGHDQLEHPVPGARVGDGVDWIDVRQLPPPEDGLQTGISSEQLMRQLLPGHRFIIVPRIEAVITGINQTRMALSSNIYIDEVGCADGIAALDSYQKKYN